MSEESIPEKKPQEDSDLFRLLVASVKDYSIFYLDPEGYIRSWNEGAQRTKGYTAEEIIGNHFSIFYPPQEVRHGKPQYGLRVAADEGRWEEEGWRVRKDGTRFWANVVITALHDDQGKLVGFGKVTRDLSERKRNDDERRQLLELERLARLDAETALERLQAIQKVTETALVHLSLDDLLPELLELISEILLVDAAAVVLVDDESQELVTRAVVGSTLEQTPGIPLESDSGFIGQIALLREPRVIDDLLATPVAEPVLRDSRVRSVMGVPLLIKGHVLGVLYVGVTRYRRFTESDVQYLGIMADRIAMAIEHRRLNEAAQAARIEADVAEATLRTQNEFLSIAAHELKTPVSIIKLAAQLLLKRYEHPELLDATYVQRSLKGINGQADRIGRLIEHLLDTSRLEARKLTLERSRTNVTDLARQVVSQLQLGAQQQSLNFSAEEEIWADVDSLRIEQVVINLLDNAMKFSPPDGQVDVRVHRLDDHVRLEVRDRGPGIAPEHRSHLFGRFYQAHKASHQSGLGLGLYISREIVTLHGGTIDAEFPPDGGTCLVVTLPIEGIHESSAVESQSFPAV